MNYHKIKECFDGKASQSPELFKNGKQPDCVIALSDLACVDHTNKFPAEHPSSSSSADPRQEDIKKIAYGTIKSRYAPHIIIY
jgi:hypothetical protein